MRWKVRLKGGPFDSDAAEVEWDVVPEVIWVKLCAGCRNTHWYSAWHRGSEVYGLDEKSDEKRTALYVYMDTSGDGGQSIWEQIEEPELQPA